MPDCHHKSCCDCNRPAHLEAEVIGEDGVDTYKLCESHYYLLMQEAALKGIPMIGVSPADDDL